MNQDDRYHTTSWDGREVQRQQSAAGRSQARPTSAQSSQKKKKTKKQRINPLLALVLWLVIVAASSAILAGVGWMLANDFAALNKPYQEATIEVKEDWILETKTVEKEGNTPKEVTVFDIEKLADELESKGMIEYKWFFRLFNMVYHGEEKIHQGTYKLNTNMDYMALIRGMRTTGKAETVDVSVPEGYNVQQIIDLLAEKGVASKEDLTEAAKNYVYEDFGFVDNKNLGQLSRLEGYLYPDTYNFYVGGKASTALYSMLQNFNNKIYSNEDLTTLFEESEYTLSEIINIASLIEKETDGTDRGNISSVIYNRLHNAGETAYLLQIDAALVYAAGRTITQEDYATLKSPYNLYIHTGLPPTPIANPGMESIKAALKPNETNYYFYALGSEGKHIFSETLAEHQQVLAANPAE